MKKSLLALVVGLLFVGSTIDARHYEDKKDCKSCNRDTSCKTGCNKKKDDCGAVCKRTVRTESEDGYVECPRTVTVYDKVPTTRSRDIVTVTCECPAPKEMVGGWSKTCCPNKNCGQCESCRCKKGAEFIPADDADKSSTVAEKKGKQTKADKKAAAKSKSDKVVKKANKKN